MSHLIFDTLKHTNKLKAAGADPTIAELQTESIVDALNSLYEQMEKTTATKTDVEGLKTELEKLRTEMHLSNKDAKNNFMKWSVFILLFQIVIIVLAMAIEQQ